MYIFSALKLYTNQYFKKKTLNTSSNYHVTILEGWCQMNEMNAYIFASQPKYYQVSYGPLLQAAAKIGSDDLRPTDAYTDLRKFSRFLETEVLEKPLRVLDKDRNVAEGTITGLVNGLLPIDAYYRNIRGSCRELSEYDISRLSQRVRDALGQN